MYIHFVYIYFANLTTFTYTHTQKVTYAAYLILLLFCLPAFKRITIALL